MAIIFGSRSKEDDMEIAVHAICDGRVDVSGWVGDRIGLSGVAAAIDRMGDPTVPVRTMINPARM